MEFRTITKALAAASLLTVSLGSQAVEWSDTSLAVKVGDKFSEPGTAQPIDKTIYEFVHISGDKIGKNLVVGQVLHANSTYPAASGSAGSTEFFGFYRRTFSLSKLTGRSIGFGPIKDVSLAARFDRGTLNTQFASAARKLMAGVAFDWAVPKGYVETSLYVYNERNYNGIVGRRVDFDSTFRTDTNWAIPFNLGIPIDWHGAITYVGKKGNDGFGNATKPEIRLYTEFLVDIGKTGFKAGVGYELWRNKYGADQGRVPGAKQNTPLLVAEYHF